MEKMGAENCYKTKWAALEKEKEQFKKTIIPAWDAKNR